jgi:hypothetical protein
VVDFLVAIVGVALGAAALYAILWGVILTWSAIVHGLTGIYPGLERFLDWFMKPESGVKH